MEIGHNLKDKFKGYRDRIMGLKVYARRTWSYVVFIQASMIFYLFIESLVERGVVSSMYHLLWMFPTLVFMIIFLGWLDVKFGFLKAEQKKMFNEIPQIVETLKIVKEINKKSIQRGKE